MAQTGEGAGLQPEAYDTDDDMEPAYMDGEHGTVVADLDEDDEQPMSSDDEAGGQRRDTRFTP